MNCCKCGEEIAAGKGNVCEECFDEISGRIGVAVIDEINNDSEQEVDDFRKKCKKLSPRDAISFMLNGGTLLTETGYEVCYCDKLNCFVEKEKRSAWVGFENLYLRVTKTRPMDTFECLAWVNSPESIGWLVSEKHESIGRWGDWDIPQRFRYNSTTNSYRRAKILPDKSGIDESTIQGFLMEVSE